VIHEPQSIYTTVTGLAVGDLVTDIYMPVLPSILPRLILNNGYSSLAAGLLVTAYNVTSSFTQPALGWLFDAKGFTINLSISLLMSAVFVALIGIATNYSMIMLFAVLAALGHACFHPASLSRVSRLCTSENRGRVTSNFVVGGNIVTRSVRYLPGRWSSGWVFLDSCSSYSRRSSWHVPCVTFCRGGLQGLAGRT
jgi:MFS family permease